jgi:hypothetical protein
VTGARYGPQAGEGARCDEGPEGGVGRPQAYERDSTDMRRPVAFASFDSAGTKTFDTEPIALTECRFDNS